jgi:hypothetical protein
MVRVRVMLIAVAGLLAASHQANAQWMDTRQAMGFGPQFFNGGSPIPRETVYYPAN